MLVGSSFSFNRRVNWGTGLWNVCLRSQGQGSLLVCLTPKPFSRTGVGVDLLVPYTVSHQRHLVQFCQGDVGPGCEWIQRWRRLIFSVRLLHWIWSIVKVVSTKCQGIGIWEWSPRTREGEAARNAQDWHAPELACMGWPELSVTFSGILWVYT